MIKTLKHLGGNEKETSINSKMVVQNKRHDCSVLLDSAVNIISTIIILVL